MTDPCEVKEVVFSLEGDKSLFTPEPGYGEYVAFDPSSISRAVTRSVRVNNQDIHSMPSPDMLMVAYSEYAEAAKKIARLHEEADGFNVTVLTPEEIYSRFSGGHPDVGAFRKLLKMWHDRNETRPIKILSASWTRILRHKMVSSGIRNAGYRPLPLWQSPERFTEPTAYSTDDIIGMLDDTDEKLTFNINAALMHVAVGRLPVTGAKSKTRLRQNLKYIKEPEIRRMAPVGDAYRR